MMPSGKQTEIATDSFADLDQYLFESENRSFGKM